MTPTPRTAAGQALLEAISHLSSDLPMVFGDEAMELLDIEATAQTILAIEAQAAPPDALREALERIAKGTERIATMLEADYLVRMPAHTKLPKVRP